MRGHLSNPQVATPDTRRHKHKIWQSETMHRLSDLAVSRRNNFTAIRLLFAWLVLFGHSFAITKAGTDPITPFLPKGTWIGALAVDGFFAISGFLVAASFVKRSAIDFVLARLLRIYPALIVCVFLSVFALGPLFTTLPLSEYFTSKDTMRHWLHNSMLWPRVHWELPGVFSDRPLNAVNGSLWTLPVEIRCYVFLFIVGWFGVLDSRLRATVGAAALLLLGYAAFQEMPLFGFNPRYARPAAYFIVGTLIWFNRSDIPLHWSIAVSMLMLPYILPSALLVSLPYLIFYCAYALPHLDLDRSGDYSYGLYLYAWPFQQAVFWEAQGPYMNALLATATAGLAAVASWHLVEKPALSFKSALQSRILAQKRKLHGVPHQRPDDRLLAKGAPVQAAPANAASIAGPS